MRKYPSESLVSKTKKVHEKEILNKFLDRLDIQNRSIRESEKPDFIVKINNVTHGFELTDFYWDINRHSGSISKEKQNFWIKIARAIQKKAKENNGLKYCFGAAHFKNDRKLFSIKKSQNDFIDQILSLAKIHISEIEKGIMITNFNGFPLLEDTLEGLFLESTGSREDILWWEASLQSGLIDPKVYQRGLLLLLKQKIEQGRTYVRPEGLNVLVIFASKELLGSRGYRIFEIPNIDHCPFDHIYFWDEFSETIDEFYPNKKPILRWDKDGGMLFLKNLPSAFKI